MNSSVHVPMQSLGRSLVAAPALLKAVEDTGLNSWDKIGRVGGDDDDDDDDDDAIA